MDAHSFLIGYLIGGAVQSALCVVVIRIRLAQVEADRQ